jgi:hypothetical protein
MLQDKAQGYVWNKTEDTVYMLSSKIENAH